MRRLRGLLNRMSEQNIEGVSAEVAQLFGQSSQRQLAKALTSSIMGSCLSEAQVLAPLVLLNAALLRGLSLRAHAAELVPRFVEDLVGELQRALDEGGREHAASNALLFIASLYNLGALHCKLLYELIGELVRRWGEIELSLLCLLLRSVGPQLRADDPAALRDIIVQVQQQEAAQAVVGDGAPSQRMRVFVQMVFDLKNNRTRKQEQAAADGALGRLQKWAKGLEARAQASSAPPFKVGWTELLEAGTRGRWWLVGSAWAGRRAEERRGAAEKKGSQRAAAEKLERLASAQRMNTDLRRGVFVAIMGAEDYVDAATRVTKLRLQRGQQADAARVLLECCGQEGVFNPFYALLGARLCGCHRELKFGLQCAYWDEFKQLEGASLHRAANLAKLLAQLLGRAALPLAALRVVPWGSLEPRAVFFWQVCFTELLQLEPAMMRAAMAQLQEPAFAELRDGVMLFIGRHLRPLVLKKTPALSEALAELVALTIPVD